jgi:hypothetical protein
MIAKAKLNQAWKRTAAEAETGDDRFGGLNWTGGKWVRMQSRQHTGRQRRR